MNAPQKIGIPTATVPASAERGTARAGNNYVSGLLCCLVAAVIWGGMFPVMTDALRHTDPFTFTSLRYLIAGVPFIGVFLYKEGFSALRIRGGQAALAWLVGSIGFAGFGFLVFWGQQKAGREGALIASIMMATQPMLGLVVSAVAKRVLPPRYSILFVLLSFFGVILVITRGDLSNLINAPQSYAANILFILGALSWVIYTFSAQYFTGWSPFKYTAITTWLGLTTVVSINLVLYLMHELPLPTAPELIAVTPHLLYMGLIAGFVGVLCWNVGNKILTPLNGVLFMDVVPLTTFIVSSISGVIPEHSQILGACVTGAALVMNNVYLRARAKRAAVA